MASADSRRGSRRGPRGALRADRPRVEPGRSGRLRRRRDHGDAGRGPGAALWPRSTRSPRRPRAARRHSPSTSGRPSSRFVRALAIEAYYSDFVAPGRDGAGRLGGDRLQLAARDAPREGLVVPGDRMKDRVRRRRRGIGRGGRRRRRRARAARPRRAAARDRPAPAPPPTSPAGRRRRRTTSGGRCGSRRFRTASWSRSSPAAASAARRRSTRRSRCAPTSVTSPSGMPATGLTNERRQAVHASPTSSRTTTGWRRCSACASEPTGRRASTPCEPGFQALGAELEPVRAVHRPELHALRLVPPGLPDERRQVDDEHVHPRRAGSRTCSSCARTRPSSGC